MTQKQTTTLQIGPYDVSRELVLDFTKLHGLYGQMSDDFSKRTPPPLQLKPPPQSQEEAKRDGAVEDVTDIPIEAFVPQPQAEFRPLTHQWELLAESKDNPKGYNGGLFSVQVGGEPFYILYHRAADNVKDFAAIGRLAEGKEPKQLAEAKDFVAQAKRLIRERHPQGDVPVLHVGYSLGGAMGNLARDEGDPMLAIDPPPVSRLLQKQGRNPDALGKNLVTILPAHETLINAHGQHAGEVVVADEKYWKADKISLQDFWDMGWKAHDVVRIGCEMAKSDEWNKVPAGSLGRAETVLDAFRIYFNEQSEGRKLKVDERLLGWMKDHPLTREAYEAGTILYGKIGKLLGGKTVLDGHEGESHLDRLKRERREEVQGSEKGVGG